MIAGDGDLMEGISGEAVSLAGHLGLGKLIVLYDDNKFSLAGPTGLAFTEDVAKRYEAYGWHTQLVEPPHANDADAIDAAIQAAKESPRPSLIVLRTHIGYGSPRQDTFMAHGEPLGPDGVRSDQGKAGLAARAGLLRPRRRARVVARERQPRRTPRSEAWQTVLATLKASDSPLARAVRTRRARHASPTCCRGPSSPRRTATSRRAMPAAR